MNAATIQPSDLTAEERVLVDVEATVRYNGFHGPDAALLAYSKAFEVCKPLILERRAFFTPAAPAFGRDSDGEPRKVVCGQCGKLTTEDPCEHCQIGNPEGWKGPEPAHPEPKVECPNCEQAGEHYDQRGHYICKAAEPHKPEPAAPVEMPEAVADAWWGLNSSVEYTALELHEIAKRFGNWWRDHSRTVAAKRDLPKTRELIDLFADPNVFFAPNPEFIAEVRAELDAEGSAT